MLRRAGLQTWSTVEQHILGIFLTILTPVVLYAISFIPAIQQAFKDGGFMQEWIIALIGVGLVIAYILGVFTKNVIFAPSIEDKNLRDNITEKEALIGKLEEEQKPKFIVKPTNSKREQYENTELTSWAELAITNDSSTHLNDVSVKIMECVNVLEKTDREDGRDLGKYFLATISEWHPSSVYWSGRTGDTNEANRPLKPTETQYATIAFHHKHGTGLGTFNILAHPPMTEAKIAIEVSSPNSNTWRGEFYIGYRPASTDRFEFEEWETWCKSHEIIEPSIPDKKGFQI